MEKSLYKINAEYLELFGRIELAEGVLTPELEEELIIKKSELEVKSIAYAEVIKQRESFNTRIDDEVKRLQAIKKSNETLIDRLKTNLVSAVNIFGSFKSGFLTFGIRKSTSVEVNIDTNSLDKEYKCIKVTETPDKIKIKKAIESGHEVYGCRLVENINLTIK